MNVDRTLAMIRRGYPWAHQLRRAAGAVPTRLLGGRAVVIGGAAGVRRFYDPRLRRSGAVPLLVKLVLFGPGTVHGLDDAEHHHRKAMFLQVLTPEAVASLGQRAEQEWELAARRWEGNDRVVLFDEAVQVLAASVLPWAGVPIVPEELLRRARQLVDVLEGFARPGPAYIRAALARWRLDRWAGRLVAQQRSGQIYSLPGTALHAASTAIDRHGQLLPERVAAVALLNIVRPTVAVAWFVTFAGKALHDHPEWRRRIADGDRPALDAFVHEVRRFYPFVPVLAARAREKQDVLGIGVRPGALVVLDVHGTNHDPAHWPDPERFDPSRFLSGTIDPDTLVPQGGGEVRTGHRCPGEDVTLTMLAIAVRTLAGLSYTLPPQDLDFDLARVPTRPRSGVVLALHRTQC
jgi:fatty-acid peroxygenase